MLTVEPCLCLLFKTGRNIPPLTKWLKHFTCISLNRKDCTIKSDMKAEKEVDLDTSINTKHRRQSTSVDVTLTIKMAEIKKLREKCNTLEESECNLKVVYLILLH